MKVITRPMLGAFLPILLTTTIIPMPKQPITRLSFIRLSQPPARIYSIYFRIFWIFFTYVACRVVFFTLVAGRGLLQKNEVTELDRLLYDLAKVGEYNFSWLCFIMISGCLVGFVPRLQLRAVGIRAIMSHLVLNYLCNFLTCWRFYRILKDRGFEVIVRFCQNSHQAEDFGDLCRQAGTGAKVIWFAGIVLWKLFGLNLLALTWVWLRCTIAEETETRVRIEQEVQERAGPISIMEEKPQAMENKV